jgi:hypothetical protein
LLLLGVVLLWIYFFLCKAVAGRLPRVLTQCAELSHSMSEAIRRMIMEQAG